MKKFLFGVILTVFALMAGGYFLLKGHVSFRRGSRNLPRPKSTWRWRRWMRRRSGNAPDMKNPLPADEANLVAGAKLYLESLRGMPRRAVKSGEPVRAFVLSGGAGIFQGRARHGGEPEFLHYPAWDSLDGDARVEEYAERNADLAVGDFSEQCGKISAGGEEGIGIDAECCGGRDARDLAGAIGDAYEVRSARAVAAGKSALQWAERC